MNRILKLVLLASLVGNLTIVWVGYKAYMYRSYINFWLDKYTRVVEEFSGRSTFAEENAALRSDTTVPGRVVFLGTQVVSRWQVEEAFANWEAIGRGVDSQRVAGFLLRFRPDVISLGPVAVVIETSSYNFRPESSVSELEDYAISMAELARANGIEPIMATVIPPPDRLEDLGDYSLLDSIAVFNRMLRRGAEQGEWRVADFHAALSDEQGLLRRDLSRGGIDPNEAGYQLMAAEVEEALQQLP